ncbi:hypothetical protein K1T71_001080 [Dendrolimus kikuchii]|uniref:Uncharacterized protein n=1 Tax=Dendrolimus kikuchii TaxID=765133 RepID=A0ACC1DGL8_9NEOP|nr:hypothetical protein K1T71_001080 [Dendrolimus kikuchii]
MLESSLDNFSNDVFRFLTGENKSARGLLVKKHSENLCTHGEFSFPNTVKSWHGFVDMNKVKSQDGNFLKCVGKEITTVMEESVDWEIKVNKVKEEKDRVYLFLERSRTTYIGLLEGLKNNTLITHKLHNICSKVTVDPVCIENNTITSLRVNYLCYVVRNLCLIVDNKQWPEIIVTSKSSSKSNEKRILFCGPVLNANTGSKESIVNADAFIRIRQDEMTLIAQHKYGVRVMTNSKWKEFIVHLGESAVKFELLQIKPNSAIKINFDCSSTGSSKGASFILYNCARLETIIRTYNEKVNVGTYPPLPDFKDTDFTLLSQEDEWCLIFNFILGLPSLLENCVEINDKSIEIRPHLICTYLCSMVRVFSQYYRRTRILMEPRKHLLPVIFARMHMLKILNDTLKSCLNILSIKSVNQM